MAFDPRCVAFEGRLHADHCTAEYIGRASHDSDAACFRSRDAVTARTCSQILRLFYFETQILATTPSPMDPSPVQTNTVNVPVYTRRYTVLDHDDTAVPTESDERDREDVPMAGNTDESVEIPVNFQVLLTSSTMQQMRSRIDRRRVRRGKEKKRVKHKISVGFLLDNAELKVGALGAISSSFTSFSSSHGQFEAKMSRRATKQLMQRGLPDATTRDELEEEQEQERRRDKKNETSPAILHQDLGTKANSVAYVGKTGRVISNGREFLQCERYGTGDVVGCGVLFDTNTFFFTLNGKLMGLLAARDVKDLDDFGEADGEEEEENEEDDLESGEEDEKDSVGAENGKRVQLDRTDDDMEDVDGCYEDEKVLYPSVSLHGVGECVRAVFEPDEFRFDLSSFEQQIQKERQRALLAEREMRKDNVCPSSDDKQSLCKDEAVMNELVQDFFLHYGYESAYKAFESAFVPPKRQRLASDGMGMDCSGEVEASAVIYDANSAVDTENSDKIETVNIRDAQSSLRASLKEHMRGSLSLRHEMREHIRCFRTAQALALLEQHVPAVMTIATGYRSRQITKLILNCRILCVVDVLTHNEEAKAPTLSPSLENVAPHSIRPSNVEEVGRNGWNPESAIEFAQQVFGSCVEITTYGKRKRLGLTNGTTQKKCADRNDVALAMSLLLYDQRDSIPKASHARKFLTTEFRESVADQLNSLLLMGDNYADTEPRVSALETFMTDLEHLRKECLYQGCCAYPESVEATCKSKTTSCRWRALASSSSDDSSSSQSEQEDHFEGDDNDDE